MKVKLYHKFVEDARKNAIQHIHVTRRWLFKAYANGNEFVYMPAKCIDMNGNAVLDNHKLAVVSPANFLSFVWNDLLWKEVWRKKYARYSRKYWEPEAVLKRIIRTGKAV